MSMLQEFKEMIPFGWRKGLLDLVKPHRPGIGPVLRGMDRDMSVIFDIGANVGDVSCYMLHYFPKATVFAFEPCMATYELLLANVQKTGYGNRFKPFRLGFLDKETEGMLHITSAHGANSLIGLTDEYKSMNSHIQEVKSEQIALVRLDDFVFENKIDRIDLVKIDVEGVEQQILKGGSETFATRVDAVVMEISFVRNPRSSGEYIKLFQIMHDYGFAPSAIYDLSHASTRDWRLAQFDCEFRKY